MNNILHPCKRQYAAVQNCQRFFLMIISIKGRGGAWKKVITIMIKIIIGKNVDKSGQLRSW